MNGSMESTESLYAAFRECVQLFELGDYDSADKKLSSTTQLGKRLLERYIKASSRQETHHTRVILSRLFVYRARLTCINGDLLQALSTFEEALNVCCFIDPDIIAEVYEKFMPTFRRWMSQTVAEKHRELDKVFKKQKINQNSADGSRSFYGHTVAIDIAEALRKNGTRGYNNDLLKTLHLSRARLLLDMEGPFSYLATEDCNKAIEYANGVDFEALNVAAHVFCGFGYPVRALEYCQDALKIKKTRELELLLLEIQADISDDTEQKYEIGATASDKPDEGWLEGTSVQKHRQQTERAARENGQKKKRKSSHSRTRRRSSVSNAVASENRVGGDSNSMGATTEPRARTDSADRTDLVYKRCSDSDAKDRGDIRKDRSKGNASPKQVNGASSSSPSQSPRSQSPVVGKQATATPGRGKDTA